MSGIHRIDLGTPALLEFRGPDAVRFLNGQLTQDVRRVMGAGLSLPSCVTDAKGRLQFQVSVTENEGALWVVGWAEWSEALMVRLTRYLIADDVEAADLSGGFALVHFTGTIAETPAGVVSRESNRFGVSGTDWWIPRDSEIGFPAGIPLLEGDSLEGFRISNGIPEWGHELTEGMLPPEAGLDENSISYNKGCYIGQEVISRIKSAGKVNRRMIRFEIKADVRASVGPLFTNEGAAAGELTSLSPVASSGVRAALGYGKRGVTEFFLRSPDGRQFPVRAV